MLNRIKEYIKENNISPNEDKILLAVSGGVDSMVLLDVLLKMDFDISVAYFDHLTRQGKSTEDGRFVEQYCLERHIKFYKSEYSRPEYHVNFHEEAHKQRYAFFKSLEYEYIFTAHHLDDQVETVLWQTLTGRLPFGMPLANNNILRPLINVTKAAIEQYAQKHKIPYVTDTSNVSLKYDRNFLRIELIPKIKTRIENFNQKILNLSARLQSQDLLIQKFISELDLLKSEGELYRISIESLSSYGSQQAAVLHGVLKKLNFTYEQCVQMINAHTGAQFYSSSYQLVKDRKVLIMRPIVKEESKSIKFNLDKIPSTFEMNDHRFYLEWTDSIPIFHDPKLLFIPQRLIKKELEFRYWNAGDNFYPFGMNMQKQTLKKFFNNNKIDSFTKHNIPILLIDNVVAWICGYRSDERFKCDIEDERFLKIKLL